MKKGKILWVDDEIELLRSHIIFLNEKGYDVETVTNGEDAIDFVSRAKFDLIFLDEMMSGMGGLETLAKIKEINSNVPVVMVTKNEEETLMNEAIGSKINDYLLKPVNPSQVLLVCKKFLEKKNISAEYVSKDYLQDFNLLSQRIFSELNHDDWVDIYLKLINWDLELTKHSDLELEHTFLDLKRNANKEFSKFIERNYRNWLNSDESRPNLSIDVVEDSVFPLLKQKNNVFLFVLDCMRYDQWAVMEEMLYPYFNISKKSYYSILPSSTPYARNAIFAGLFPSEIEKYYPELWTHQHDDENSHNKHERELLEKLLERKRIKLHSELKYFKIIDPEYGRNFEQNIQTLVNNNLTAVVVNYLDMIAHSRSDSAILKEIAPNEAAFRSLTQSWFTHSSLLKTFRNLSNQKNVRIVITTDHGSIRCMHGAKVLGDREALPNLRYKFGRNLKSEAKQAIFIRNPIDYKLPKRGLTINYIIAKEDYYFVYPTEYNKYLNLYKDSFQHGGISMEELILPIITLEPKL
ncbi:MAG: bifunctional response regulator/alkaline phosphatase family protein [Ignavibacteria bacterium]|nr:bifunctional response regulator/alkaline phosphatase family protein [Ignavibacteria bacterium]